MARPLCIEFPGALYHVTLRGNERRRIVRDDAGRRKRIEWLRRTVKNCDWRECRELRGTPHGHGAARLSRTAGRIFAGSNDAYSLFTA